MPDGPPWPLARSELDGFTEAGLKQVNFQEFVLREDSEIPHYRVEYVRPQ